MSIKRATGSDAVKNRGSMERTQSSEHAESVAKNLDLAARWVKMVFADPSLLDQIPEGAEVVFLPEDDPEMAEMNRCGGEAMRRAGKTVTFITMV